MRDDLPWTSLASAGPWDEERFDGMATWAGLHAKFACAAALRPHELCHAAFRFAGRAVSMRVVGRELFLHVTKPFAHLRAEPAAMPALTVELWDDRILRTIPPPEHADGHTLWRESTLRSSDDRFIAQSLPHTRSCLDRERGHVVAGIAWHDAIFIYERSKPLARLLLNWCNDQSVQVIHCGLVARDGIGVMLAGKSGSGKSTTALASTLAGFDYLAEDYVALEVAGGGELIGHSLYNSVFLKSAHLAQFPALAARAIHGRPPQEQKSVVMLADLAPERLVRSVTLRALVFPSVGDTTPGCATPMTKAAALLALAPSSLLQIPNRHLGATGFERLAAVVQRLPCFRLSVGYDFGAIALGLRGIVDKVGACAR